MEPKKIILCPNPDRDTGMKATKSAIAILRDMGFQTVVCSPFRDPKTDAFGDLPSKPLLPELKGADLVITLGGDGTILHGGTGLSGGAGGWLFERFARPEKLGFSH